MKKVLKILSIIFAVITICFCTLWFNHDIGINKNHIEQDARGSSKIEDAWMVAIDTTEIMSAMVFYPEDKSDHSYKVYVNRPGTSFGYFFRGGGDVIEVEYYIAECFVENYDDRAFISLNAQQVERMEIDNGNEVKIIEIDSSKPFAYVLAKNSGTVTFFDINENIVEVMQKNL